MQLKCLWVIWLDKDHFDVLHSSFLQKTFHSRLHTYKACPSNVWCSLMSVYNLVWAECFSDCIFHSPSSLWPQTHFIWVTQQMGTAGERLSALYRLLNAWAGTYHWRQDEKLSLFSVPHQTLACYWCHVTHQVLHAICKASEDDCKPCMYAQTPKRLLPSSFSSLNFHDVLKIHWLIRCYSTATCVWLRMITWA